LAVLVPFASLCQYHKIAAGGSLLLVIVVVPQTYAKEKLVIGVTGVDVTVTVN
jgi:hypothetical protein